MSIVIRNVDLIMLELDDTIVNPIHGPDIYIGHLVYSVARDAVDSMFIPS